jgi:hypothetical protein
LLWVRRREYRVDYRAAESGTGLFGGNSNWRGPIWFPVNFLIIEALQRYHFYLGDSFVVEYPTGSGVMLNLWQVAEELSRRLMRIFLKDENGRRPVFGNSRKMQEDPHFRDHVLFYEYFNGDDGSGLGASHQTGWTGLVAKLLQQTNPDGVAASAHEPESEGRSTTGSTAPRKGERIEETRGAGPLVARGSPLWYAGAPRDRSRTPRSGASRSREPHDSVGPCSGVAGMRA